MKFVDVSASKKMHSEESEFKSMLGKRHYNSQVFFEEEFKTLKELSKLSNAQKLKKSKGRRKAKKSTKMVSKMISKIVNNPPAIPEKEESISFAQEDIFSLSNDTPYSPRSESQFSSLIDTENTPS